MAMTEEKRQYFAEYKKTHLKKIQADVQIEYYERMKNICELEGISTTKFVKRAVDAALEKLEEDYGINPKWKISIYTDKNGKKRYRRITGAEAPGAFDITKLKKKVVDAADGQGKTVVYLMEDQDGS